MSEPLTIFVHHDKGDAAKVVVDPNETLQNLDKHLILPKFRFVFFNNMVLLGAFTYSFYKIQNGDHIYVIPIAFSSAQNIKNSILHAFIPNINEPKKEVKPNPEKRISSFLRETARLKDQFLQKVEGTMYRKPLGLLSGIMRSRAVPAPPPPPPPPPAQNIPTVIPQLSTKPSSDALPLLWSTNETEDDDDDDIDDEDDDDESMEEEEEVNDKKDSNKPK